MIRIVYTEAFDLPAVDTAEIFRYAGVRTASVELEQLMEDALSEAAPLLTGKVCWAEFPVSSTQEMLDLGFAKVHSASLSRNLSGCDRILVFGATVGLALDRLIVRYGHTAPSKALMLQAIGAERIEALCDAFCEKLRQEAAIRGLHLRPRFSPGYGDLPLELQTDIFRVLDCSRRIGLTLNESLLMSPSKSVTAIVGLSPCPGIHAADGCCQCGKTDCIYRRTP